MAWRIVVFSLLMAAQGCEWLGEVRHGARDWLGVVGEGGLELTVEPGSAVTVLIDGEQVGTESPVSVRLPVGPHMLSVQKDGYHPFLLRVDVLDGETLQIPVALRPKGEGVR